MKTLKGRLDWFIVFLVLTIVFFILFIVAYVGVRSNGHYEYETFDGEVNEAKDCSRVYGNLICVLEDGTRVQVRQWREIK